MKRDKESDKCELEREWPESKWNRENKGQRKEERERESMSR